ncbi:hypothetical protein GNZ12_26745 [Paraburkholderia sp. 1N]|uniref:HNH endonuclease n=1 Tax=Paraburkholderia solitsugae TaxID=2675748 RepID=A0ABX2BXN8_9BURK|nr:hypothetical protein [Paraburkholderia solitsugae]NPT44851.1 hypothetical protein [Paraburkholderia solitsugae]
MDPYELIKAVPTEVVKESEKPRMPNHSLHKVVLTAMFTFVAATARAGDLPDSRFTPGAINPDVTQANIHQTVCVKGYTKAIRPPAYYTNALKKRQIEQFGYADRKARDYEEDHLVALSIGGAPTDERNLWPQPRNSEWSADKKDQLEFVLYKMVCNEEISLKQAQREMATDWIEAWKRYVPTHPDYRFKGE